MALAEGDQRDPLDDYVEAQVHGVVDLCRDVEASARHRGVDQLVAPGR